MHKSNGIQKIFMTESNVVSGPADVACKDAKHILAYILLWAPSLSRSKPKYLLLLILCHCHCQHWWIALTITFVYHTHDPHHPFSSLWTNLRQSNTIFGLVCVASGSHCDKIVSKMPHDSPLPLPTSLVSVPFVCCLCCCHCSHHLNAKLQGLALNLPFNILETFGTIWPLH